MRPTRGHLRESDAPIEYFVLYIGATVNDLILNIYSCPRGLFDRHLYSYYAFFSPADICASFVIRHILLGDDA